MAYKNTDLQKLFLPICICTLLLMLLCSCTSEGPLRLFSSKVKDGVTLEGKQMGNLTRDKVEEEVRIQAEKKDRQVVNASVNTDNWDIIPEQVGYKVNVPATVTAIMKADKAQEVKIIGTEIMPDITAETLKNSVVIIGESSTPILDSRENRVNNIDISITAIDKKILNPGEQFSFNEIVGQRTESKGYEKAPIIVGKHKEMATGGGVCQLSTTLFNAADSAGLNITERHVHSKSIGYVPNGKDATISYGSKDLKFTNNRQFQIMIRAEEQDGEVHAWIIEKRS